MFDHSGLNRSFDIYEVDRVPELYRDAYQRANVTAAHSSGTQWKRRRSLPAAGMFLRHHGKGATILGSRSITNVPMQNGDALVLRQPEIHRTDARIDEGQWRLAVGFKVIESAPLTQLPGKSPVAKRIRSLQARWPRLTSITVGTVFPDWYGAQLEPHQPPAVGRRLGLVRRLERESSSRVPLTNRSTALESSSPYRIVQ